MIEQGTENKKKSKYSQNLLKCLLQLDNFQPGQIQQITEIVTRFNLLSTQDEQRLLIQMIEDGQVTNPEQLPEQLEAQSKLIMIMEEYFTDRWQEEKLKLPPQLSNKMNQLSSLDAGIEDLPTGDKPYDSKDLLMLGERNNLPPLSLEHIFSRILSIEKDLHYLKNLKKFNSTSSDSKLSQNKANESIILKLKIIDQEVEQLLGWIAQIKFEDKSGPLRSRLEQLSRQRNLTERLGKIQQSLESLGQSCDPIFLLDRDPISYSHSIELMLAEVISRSEKNEPLDQNSITGLNSILDSLGELSLAEEKINYLKENLNDPQSIEALRDAKKLHATLLHTSWKKLHTFLTAQILQTASAAKVESKKRPVQSTLTIQNKLGKSEVKKIPITPLSKIDAGPALEQDKKISSISTELGTHPEEDSKVQLNAQSLQAISILEAKISSDQAVRDAIVNLGIPTETPFLIPENKTIPQVKEEKGTLSALPKASDNILPTMAAKAAKNFFKSQPYLRVYFPPSERKTKNYKLSFLADLGIILHLFQQLLEGIGENPLDQRQLARFIATHKKLEARIKLGKISKDFANICNSIIKYPSIIIRFCEGPKLNRQPGSGVLFEVMSEEKHSSGHKVTYEEFRTAIIETHKAAQNLHARLSRGTLKTAELAIKNFFTTYYEFKWLQALTYPDNGDKLTGLVQAFNDFYQSPYDKSRQDNLERCMDQLVPGRFPPQLYGVIIDARKNISNVFEGLQFPYTMTSQDSLVSCLDQLVPEAFPPQFCSVIIKARNNISKVLEAVQKSPHAMSEEDCLECLDQLVPGPFPRQLNSIIVDARNNISNILKATQQFSKDKKNIHSQNADTPIEYLEALKNILELISVLQTNYVKDLNEYKRENKIRSETVDPIASTENPIIQALKNISKINENTNGIVASILEDLSVLLEKSLKIVNNLPAEIKLRNSPLAMDDNWNNLQVCLEDIIHMLIFSHADSPGYLRKVMEATTMELYSLLNQSKMLVIDNQEDVISFLNLLKQTVKSAINVINEKLRPVKIEILLEKSQQAVSQLSRDGLAICGPNTIPSQSELINAAEKCKSAWEEMQQIQDFSAERLLPLLDLIINAIDMFQTKEPDPGMVKQMFGFIKPNKEPAFDPGMVKQMFGFIKQIIENIESQRIYRFNFKIGNNNLTDKLNTMFRLLNSAITSINHIDSKIQLTQALKLLREVIPMVEAVEKIIGPAQVYIAKFLGSPAGTTPLSEINDFFQFLPALSDSKERIEPLTPSTPRTPSTPKTPHTAFWQGTPFSPTGSPHTPLSPSTSTPRRSSTGASPVATSPFTTTSRRGSTGSTFRTFSPPPPTSPPLNSPDSAQQTDGKTSFGRTHT